MNSTIQLANIIFGVGAKVLGATDNKMMIITQGCSHVKCKGCMSPHTWDSKAGNAWAINEVINLAERQSNSPTGLVISGGEPLDQINEVMELIAKFRQKFAHAEVILFTAYQQSHLIKHYQDLLHVLDVVVAGAYVEKLTGYSLLGSSNQKVMLLTEQAKINYHDWQSWHCQSQVFIDNGEITLVGLQDTRNLNFGNGNNNTVFFRQKLTETMK